MPICSVVKVTNLITYKYCKKRHALFLKFDQCILMDEESFPETLSAYMAEKCDQVKVAVDPVLRRRRKYNPACLTVRQRTMPYQTSLPNRSTSICIAHSARISGIV
ncbi:uncharacterized protein LOC132943231 [Metopolophium dirhodum]|uniref:uncharacterized protein LOC132943231 n=1 Tax=Metopolophium dirhodum TaxID=44670 RepID=UPI00298FF0E1|nr:uncharacterized protein LOC132943231 [Metopolophium dirhodum]